MNREKLLVRLKRGDVANVSFMDMKKLAEWFGFKLARTAGSHHIYRHPLVPGLLNLQDAGGEAKPYQVRQFLRMVELYNVHGKEES